MHRLPLAARPPAPPSHCDSYSFSVSQRRAACCCSLKQAAPGGSSPSPLASFAAAATQRAAAPLLAASLLLAASPPAFAEPASGGAALFRKACIGCHDTGGNILQPGATLFMKDLERNGVATDEEIYNITYYGKGRMPGFGEKCTPRGQCTFGPRLPEDDIKMLAAFVKSQAENGWPKIDGDVD